MLHLFIIDEKPSSEPHECIIKSIDDIETIKLKPSTYHPVNTEIRMKSGDVFYAVQIIETANYENNPMFNYVYEKLHKFMGNGITK